MSVLGRVTLKIPTKCLWRWEPDGRYNFFSYARLGNCFTPYQRLRLYNGAPFSRLLRHAGDTEDVFSA